MTYLRRHYNCESGCKIHTAYIRVGKKWKRVGQFHTICGQFKLDKSLKCEIEVVQEEPKIIESTPKMHELYKMQISDQELFHLCNSLAYV